MKNEKNLFNEFTKFWTRCVQLILSVSFIFVVLSFVGMYIIPMVGITIMGNMTEAQASNMFELVRMWGFPMLFLVLALLALSLVLCKWFYSKSILWMNKVRIKLIELHEKSVTRKQLVEENKRDKGRK